MKRDADFKMIFANKSFTGFPANIYLFNDVVLVFLLLTLNIFHTFFYCLYRWIWTSKC